MIHARHIVCFILATALLGACTMGQKDWPRPSSGDSAFSWLSVTDIREGACIVIEGRMDGAFENLAGVTVQLQPMGVDAGCVDCPFKAVLTVNVGPGAHGYEHIGPYVQAVVCDLEPGREYRYRIFGIHKTGAFDPVQSGVFTSAP